MVIPEKLKSWVEKWVLNHRIPSPWTLSSLQGDGSTRSFFRLTTSNEKWIVLFDPAWTSSQDYPKHQFFLNSHKIPVPAFDAIDAATGILVMQDLGDELLQHRLQNDTSKKMEWLKKAAVLLAKLHGETFPVSPEIPASTRRFDAKKYGEEFRYTLEHLHTGLLKLPKITDLSSVDALCSTLEKLGPEVFAHRDYHCRNLLVHQDNLFMIDFQDARLGPPHYDLASLIYDAYVPMTDDERTVLIHTYKEAVKGYVLSDAIGWDNFDEDLALVGYQRTIKAAGSFASFYTRNNKTTHLPYLAPALTSAIKLEARLGAKVAALRDVLPLKNWLSLVQKLKVQ